MPARGDLLFVKQGTAVRNTVIQLAVGYGILCIRERGKRCKMRPALFEQRFCGGKVLKL